MTDANLGLHSHSGIEREMNMVKNKVLIDFKFAPMFDPFKLGKVFTWHGRKFVEVDILAFVSHGGEFKNYKE